MSDLVTVHIYNSRMEAEVAKGFLESKGIQAIIAADDAGGMRPYPLAYVQGMELRVLERDLEKAKRLLAERKVKNK